jgi:hypothetical protein
MVTREGTESMDLRLYVSTLAQGGNAARAAGLFPDADDAFRMVRKILVHHDIEDLALLARIDDLESALRRDQGRLPDAERLLGRALVLYGMLEPSPISDKARVMVGLAHLYKLRGMLIEAVEVTEGALRMLEESGAWSRDPRSCFAAMHDLVSYCLDLGSTRRASQILESHRQLIDDITEPFDRARVTALRRRIASYSK